MRQLPFEGQSALSEAGTFNATPDILTGTQAAERTAVRIRDETIIYCGPCASA